MFEEAGGPIEILLVEDNPGDVRLTMEALREGKIYNTLRVAQDGLEAMDMLRQEGEHAKTPLPDIILLDLNLPRKNGCDVLAEIKSDEKLKRIPVVVLTSSQAEEDILKAYGLHANCFVTKPTDLEQFINVIKSIEGFWGHIARLPGFVYY